MFEVSEKSLRKTTEEKMFLRNISALERSYAEEKDHVLKESYGQQLAELRARLSSLSSQGGNNSPLQGNSGSQIKPSGLSASFGFAAAGGSGDVFSASVLGKAGKGIGFPVDNGKESKQNCSCEEHGLFLRYHRLILNRYSAFLSEKERKTVGEIKSLVTKDDLTVRALAGSFSGEGYDFARDYFVVAERALNYVRDEIKNLEDVDIGISFWLTPKEIVSERIADDEDKAIFLCSLLYALGDENAEVVIAELDNGTPHAFAITEFSGKFLLLDPSQGQAFGQFFGMKSDVLKNYSFNGSQIKRFLYRFNNLKYEQFTQ